MIDGKVTELKAIERKDLNKLLYWRNLENFRKYFREYRELNQTQQKSWYSKIVKGDKKNIMFSIFEKDTNYLIGACGLCYIDWINKNLNNE